nr:MULTISPECIES: hypothetical protein [Streptomyces violaceusniger group]
MEMKPPTNATALEMAKVELVNMRGGTTGSRARRSATNQSRPRARTAIASPTMTVEPHAYAVPAQLVSSTRQLTAPPSVMMPA